MLLLVSHVAHFFFNLIYENINNLFSICGKMFVSRQYKAKLHQQEKFCVLSVVKCHVH